VSGSPVSRLAEDPFAVIYNSWGSESESLQKIYSPAAPSPGGESPVLRSNVLPSSGEASGSALVGLGIGLMEPFRFPRGPPEDESDLDSLLMYPTFMEEEGDEAEVANVLALLDEERGDGGDEQRAPRKRRKTFV
jgi:hypothetical protein